MAKQAHKISKKWIEQNRLLFREFLAQTDFPDPECIGDRGPRFQYPEWLIVFIAILPAKVKVKSYVQIHRVAMDYWDQIATGLVLKPISERQLCDRLKKICHHPRKPVAFIFKPFSDLER